MSSQQHNSQTQGQSSVQTRHQISAQTQDQSNVQTEQSILSNNPKLTIKTIINGYIISGQYIQINKEINFKINSSINKKQKYQITFKNIQTDQNLKQHFKDSYELFAYLSYSTKNKLKITQNKTLLIQLEKDKSKFIFPYSLNSKQQQNRIQPVKVQEIKHSQKQNKNNQEENKSNQKQNKNNQEQNSSSSKNIQTKIQMAQNIQDSSIFQQINKDKQDQLQLQKQKLQQKVFFQLQRDLEKINLQKNQEKEFLENIQQKKLLENTQEKELQDCQNENNSLIKQKLSLKTDLKFEKKPGQQQTLLQFAISSKIQPLTKLIQNNSLVNVEEVILKRFNMTEMPPFNQLSMKGLKNLVLEDNMIGKIQNMQTCSNLQKLNLDSNKIQIIQNLDYLTSLKFLKLGNNQISKLDGLNKLLNLETLWLDFNNITKIQNLQKLKSLKSLNLSFNQIQKIQNLEPLKQLWELMISDNQLTYISGLDFNVKLGRLALNSNMIEHISGLRKLLLLQNLHLIGNQICQFDKKQFEQLNWLKMLKQVKLNGNGIIVDEQNKQLFQRLRNYGIKVWV